MSRSPVLLLPQDATRFEALKARHLLLAFLLINLMVGLGVMLLARVLNLQADDPLLAYAVYCLTSILIWGWSWQRGQQVNLRMGQLWGNWRVPVPWGSLVRVVLALVILSLGTTLLMLYLVSLTSLKLAESMLSSLEENTSETAWPSVYQGLRWFSIVAIAPVTEEWLFRGILLHRWGLKWGIPQGLLASSVLFGLLHPNPIGLTMFGLVMGLFYLQTRSLTLPVLAHVLNNILALTLESLGGEGIEQADSIGIFYLYYSLFCLILAGLILVPFIRFHWPERDAQLPYFLNG
ncbi:MAG: lysostaphin resistance A-like protein [Cyanobacteriota bacterium]